MPSRLPLENPLPSDHRCPRYRRAFGGEHQGPQGCCMAASGTPKPAARSSPLTSRAPWPRLHCRPCTLARCLPGTSTSTHAGHSSGKFSQIWLPSL
ncbi:unnamed protein product, partial [Gulo gulo]